MKHLSLSSKRRAAWFLIFTITAQLFTPYYSYALTGGPSQPEVQSFEPIGTSEMVDVSSGSFTYNIPLLEVGGYPINLAYHSGSTPDDEATVCGLGWNINPGVVNRNMRGLPDDFSGDEVKKEFNLKPNRTFGGSFGPKIELFGVSKPKKGTLSLSSNMGVFYNNYNGVGFEFGISPGFSAGEKGSNTASFGLGLTANSQQGISLSPSMNFTAKQAKSEKGSDRGSLNGGLSIGNTINSRDGLTALTFGAKVGTDKNAKNAVGKAARKIIKAAKDIGLLDGTSTYSFATPSYSPSATLPFLNLSYSGAFTFGMEAVGLHFGGTARGYFSQQSLLETKTQNRAFGFLYAQNGAGNANALMDFNREKDGPFTKNTKHLPPVVFTNDIYGVTGQGIAGSYQLKRGDMGLLSDPRVQNFAAGANTGFEVGIGVPPAVHFGGDLKLSVTDSRSGRWEEHNDAGPEIDFKTQGNHVNDPNFEPAYFKIAGEKSVETDPAFFTNNSSTEAVRVDIEKGGITDMNVLATKNWVAPNNSKYGINQTKRNARERRNQAIAYLTAGEAQHFGLETSILNYPINNFTTPPQKLSRTGGTTVSDFNRQAHHLSEVSVLRQDGLRYFYGIPAYNTEQSEVSFSVDGAFADCSTGLVKFNPGTDDSDKNNKGEENYYNKIIMPAYAHSYLLTAIVSQDYVDLTGDGPTTDDHGTYTKFNYHRVHADYAWRVPYYNEIGTSQNPVFNQPVANFNEGFKSDGEDDKANYVSGKKEYWVLHSVESKTQVAEFYYDTNARTDALSATGQKLPRLDRITLFSRPDRLVNNSTATPIKSVWFQYDQSLCGVIPNGGTNGKLTLKKVWFTNGVSQKGKLSPYIFEYGKRLNGKDINPTYNLKAYNRWGSYQPNNGVANSTSCYNDPKNAPLNNADFPYAEQDTTKANDYAHAYNLTKITLPSGGEIKVDYEANHYAFTQNRRAMEMIEVAGAGDSGTSYPGTTDLFKTNAAPAPGSETGNNRIFLKLSSPVSSKAEFFEKYLRGAFGDKTMADGYLYFKFLTRINSVNSPVPGGKYEYVPGYVQVDDYDIGFDQTTNQAYAYLDLRHVGVQDFNLPPKIPITIPPVFYTSPIAKAGWQFTRIHLPKVAYGNTLTNTPQNFGQEVVTELANTVAQMKKFVVGFNNSMLIDRFSQEFVPGKSWMRLCSPEGDKIAGGSRVKSIRISDGWDKMDTPNGKSFEYGQTYDYTTVENRKTISSGVAAYEPALGGDENPFRQPQIYSLKPILAPATEYIQEEPFGESFFPSAQIVYSKVTVRNLQYSDVTRTATGAVVHEFFTARDFPTITENTGAKSLQKKTKGIFKQLLLKHKDYMTATEGFVIELNDMHGKPKKQSVYDEGDTKISGVEYRYKHRGDRLVNERIPVVNKHGVIENATVGLEFSMFTDSREMFSKTRDMGLELNSDNFLLGFWPFISVIPLPTYHVEETRFRSMVTMKVVQRYGILDETIAYDLGASVSTKNLAFDAETGEVLLTETSNEFEDPIFNFNIPAHWAYEGMRGAYQNLGAEFSGVVVAGGIYNAPLHYFFTPGDEIIEVLAANSPTSPQKFWVKDVDRSTGEVYLIDEYGYPIPSFSGRIKIIRSGARNQQMSSIGSVTSLRKPFNKYGDLDFYKTEIINASATEFSDRWQTWCGKKMTEVQPCKCKETQSGIQLLNVLNGQISGGQFLLRPKTNPLPLSAGQFSQYQQMLDNECNLNNPASQYWLAIELVGNDLVLSFGKSYSDLVPCWKECLVIPDFGILLNPSYGPAPTVQQFINLKPELTACDGKGFCFSAKVLTYLNQNGGNLNKTPFAAVFNFCGQGSCLPIFDCKPASPQSLCDSKIVNPYRTTNRGVFRPLRSWAYLTDRKQDLAGANIRVDGAFDAFTSFWAMPAILSQTGIPPIWESKNTGWTWTSEVTRYNPIGNELENRDPLNRFAAELTGYAHTQVTASAKNARYRQIAFDGFEDYEFDRLNNLNPCIRRHFGFDGQLVKRDISHSGKYALQLAAGANTVSKDTIVLPTCPAPLGSKPPNQPFMLDDCDCVGVFSPDPGKYVFSAWVRETRDAFALNFNQASVTISDGVLTAQTLKAEGPIIEGWQRISGEFEISPTAKNIEIKLNAAPDVTTWFDDVRAHPFDASFKSFVYDDMSLRFTYELDENNFFTKYEYDQQGALERVKKETVNGVMTIQESRFSNGKW